ncbi:MAG: hypothetical protein DRQ59_15080 [Gammaproteobacteria bacterium]|nr:MAG: hypothetical protein DRQ59_15080 [Gammaproteobacteria bacterium]
MKNAENPESFVKVISLQTSETDTVGTEQPDPVQQGEHLYGFFAIGMIVNVVMLIAFFIWAYRQWNKKGTEE